MTNQELIANLDIDQKTGKISLEQWSEMRGVIAKLIRDGAKRGAAEMETGYTETEESCKGCMGPCGMCEDTVIRDARELEEIVRLGTKMRTAQKAYFRTRTTEWLDESKKLEREFDVAAAKKLDETPKKVPDLFS